MADDNGVKISTKEIYDMAFQALRSIEKIEAKIENIHHIEEICRDAAENARIALKLVQGKQDNRKYIFQMFLGAMITGIVTVVIYFISGGKVQ